MEKLALVTKAHMANNTGREHQSPSRPPVHLLAYVLLLGPLLAWWGTRYHRGLFGESLLEPLAARGMVLPQATQGEGALLDRGSEISQLQCAGCHEMATRSSAPSYREIVTFYRREIRTVDRREFPDLCGNPGLVSGLASAVTHPRPGWGN